MSRNEPAKPWDDILSFWDLDVTDWLAYYEKWAGHFTDLTEKENERAYLFFSNVVL